MPECNGNIGETVIIVKLSIPNGGSGGIMILIDNYLHATIHKVRGEWICYPNEKSWIMGDDVRILLDIFEDRERSSLLSKS